MLFGWRGNGSAGNYDAAHPPANLMPFARPASVQGRQKLESKQYHRWDRLATEPHPDMKLKKRVVSY